MMESTQTTHAESNLSSMVARLADVISASQYPNGDRAALRRWAPGQPVPLAFYRLWLRHVNGELPPDPQTELWMALAWGLATLGKHESKRPLGQALAESGFSEGRLERLLSAPDTLRVELFMGAVRFLAAKDEAFDWNDAAAFLLATDAGKRDSIHRRIAASYFRYLPKD